MLWLLLFLLLPDVYGDIFSVSPSRLYFDNFLPGSRTEASFNVSITGDGSYAIVINQKQGCEWIDFAIPPEMKVRSVELRATIQVPTDALPGNRTCTALIMFKSRDNLPLKTHVALPIEIRMSVITERYHEAVLSKVVWNNSFEATIRNRGNIQTDVTVIADVFDNRKTALVNTCMSSKAKVMPHSSITVAFPCNGLNGQHFARIYLSEEPSQHKELYIDFPKRGLLKSLMRLMGIGKVAG